MLPGGGQGDLAEPPRHPLPAASPTRPSTFGFLKDEPLGSRPGTMTQTPNTKRPRISPVHTSARSPAQGPSPLPQTLHEREESPRRPRPRAVTLRGRNHAAGPRPHPGARASWSAHPRGETKAAARGAPGHCTSGPRRARGRRPRNGAPAAARGPRAPPGLADAGECTALPRGPAPRARRVGEGTSTLCLQTRRPSPPRATLAGSGAAPTA